MQRKTSGKWCYKLSAPGGHLEESDADTCYAVAREFTEETEVKTQPEDWIHIETFPGFHEQLVHVFAAKDDKFMAARQPSGSDEPIYVMNVQDAFNDPRMDGIAVEYIRKSLRTLRNETHPK
jgi:ADP-ribose pyrophosphatase YjhB (NUDIX family)